MRRPFLIECKRQSMLVMLRRLTSVVALAFALTGPGSSAFGQATPAVPEDFLDHVRRSGDRIHFCLNPASALMEFDRAVGQRLADMLLLPAEFTQLANLNSHYGLDYRITLTDSDLFIQVSNECDALIGFPNPAIGTIQEWLMTTQPYYKPRFVLAFGPGVGAGIDDLAAGAIIGSRVSVYADSFLRAFLETQGNRWQRRIYSGNDGIVADLVSGAIQAAVVWEPAINLAAATDPLATGIRVVDQPFALPVLELAIALPTNQVFLRNALDAAITELRRGGLNQLLAEFGLPAE
ncbi:MAG: transporter substrate-binding domain-containing protein [Bauldia sp.]|nr:transporter substrate-binding domain-containing protein [Bauldia sp.]